MLGILTTLILLPCNCKTMPRKTSSGLQITSTFGKPPSTQGCVKLKVILILLTILADPMNSALLKTHFWVKRMSWILWPFITPLLSLKWPKEIHSFNLSTSTSPVPHVLIRNSTASPLVWATVKEGLVFLTVLPCIIPTVSTNLTTWLSRIKVDPLPIWTFWLVQTSAFIPPILKAHSYWTLEMSTSIPMNMEYMVEAPWSWTKD